MKRFRIVAVLVVVALLAGGAWYWFTQRETSASGAVMASGSVDAEEVSVSSLIGGRIVEAHASEGMRVAGGQLLYRIDDAALKLQVAQAQAGVRAASAAYKQAVDDNKSDADIAAAKAQLETAQDAEKIAGIQLSYAAITAPATGTVTAVASTLGELASPGRTLATITRDGDLFVRVFVSETSIGQVSIGQDAKLETDTGEKADATVTFIASEAQFTPSNVETKDQRAKLVYEVRLKPTGAEHLNPGMPVTVTFAE
jgi:HlyD family secretion protein